MHKFEIKPLGLSDAEKFFDHMERVLGESGKGNTPVFTASSPAAYRKKQDHFLKGWNTPVTEPGWIRNWVAWAGSEIIGNVQLDGSTTESGKHRLALSIAIEERCRKRGLGSAFMSHAVDEARRLGSEWIDLSVFTNNSVAIELYKKLGFEQNGYIKDRARIFDQSFDLINMSLRIG